MGARDDERSVEVIWEPQAGPQWALLRCPVFEVFFGGARGGGKTDGMLGDFASHAAKYGKDAIGLMVRRERTQLIETIERSRQLYAPLGAKFNEQDKLWRFPNGARLRFAYLERDADADAYQGHSYTRVYVEEIGTFPSPAPIMKLMATLRSGAGVPCGFRATGNPGGPGQHWVKARYIDHAPKGMTVTKHEFRSPFDGKVITRDRVYIPSRVTDNKFLGAEYVANLQMSGSPELVRAWLEGDWNVIAGAFFPEFSMARHVCAPRELPAHWTRFVAADWGSARPFSVGWYAVSDGELSDIPRGCLVKYREWYGMAGEPNVGIKLHAEDWGAGIKARTQEKIAYYVVDPAAMHHNGGPSIAERSGIDWFAADNKRVGTVGAMGGWDQLRARLKGDGEHPGILFFSTCIHTIRTIPALQHDENRPEDVDSEAEDHAGDETRYACMSRPYVLDNPKPQPVRFGIHRTINEMIQAKRRARDD
jgi:hypothetical protein